ncbi:MAG TPA: hypothetical protein VFN61_05025 [Acidimicrobiales bacterium]|nr:hypothetical protein [Acidimicrobiales bacterium]
MSDTTYTPAPDGYDGAYTARLWALLPELYRSSDSQVLGQTGPLQELVARLGAQVAVVRRSIDRLWEDQSVESCDDWALPYIAALLATNLVDGLDARGQRLDIANTIDYRRRKGTLGLLEQLAADITGWEAKAAEMAGRLSRTRHLLDPALGWPPTSADPTGAAELQRASGLVGTLTRTPRGGVADLRSAAGAMATGTPFDEYYHRADVRTPRGTTGWYGIRKLAVFVWRAASIGVIEATPVAVGNCPGHFCLDPTGRQIELWAPRKRSSSSYGENWVSPDALVVPGPISNVLWDAVAAAGQPEPSSADSAYPVPGATFYGDGQALAVNYVDPTTLVDPGQVTVWPEVGRFLLAPSAGVSSAADIKVAYHYGLFYPVGAGPYDRRQPGVQLPITASPLVTVSAGPPGSPTALGDALSALDGQGTVEVTDGLTCTSLPALGAPGAGISAICIRASRSLPANRAVVRMPQGSGEWVIYGAEKDQAPASLRLEGLLFSGGDIVLQGNFSDVIVSCCTLDPGSAGDLLNPPQAFASAVDGTVLAPVHLFVEGTVERLVIERSITGSIRTSSGGVIGSLSVDGSIIQGLASQVPGGPAVPGPTSFTAEGLYDGAGLLGLLSGPGPKSPLVAFLSAQLATLVAGSDPTTSDLLQLLNNLVGGPLVYDANLFAGVALSRFAQAQVTAPPPTGEALAALNYLLLTEAFPVALADAAIACTTGTATLTQSTIMGDCYLHRLYASNCVLSGWVVAQDTQDGCTRFSAVTDGSALPRPYECAVVPYGEPLFVSTRFGEASYAQISDSADDLVTGPPGPILPSVLTGAETGSEMGAFCAALAPVKARSLLVKYAEYAPVGIIPFPVPVPGPDPDGERQRALPWPST